MARPRIRVIDNSIPIYFPFFLVSLLCGGAFLATELLGK